jgi:glycerophosphoryl diester phosphodiesterase
VPLVIEVKSHFDGDRKLVTRMARCWPLFGPAVGMSFDPDQVLALRELIPRVRAASSPSANMTTTTGRS